MTWPAWRKKIPIWPGRVPFLAAMISPARTHQHVISDRPDDDDAFAASSPNDIAVDPADHSEVYVNYDWNHLPFSFCLSFFLDLPWFFKLTPPPSPITVLRRIRWFSHESISSASSSSESLVASPVSRVARTGTGMSDAELAAALAMDPELYGVRRSGRPRKASQKQNA